MGNNKPRIALIACMHGNERAGLEIFKLLRKRGLKVPVKLIIANQYALKKNKRFLKSDLNRVFPGKKNGNLEEKLAYEITQEIVGMDYVIDLHSCSVESLPFAIVRNKKTLSKAFGTNLKHYVLYPLQKQGGASAIDFANYGIGLELGKHDRKKTIKDGFTAVVKLLRSIELNIQKSKPTGASIFKITGSIYKNKNFKMNSKIVNFSKVKKGEPIAYEKEKTIRAEKEFYPILYGENSYKNILCLKAKEVV